MIICSCSTVPMVMVQTSIMNIVLFFMIVVMVSLFFSEQNNEKVRYIISMELKCLEINEEN